MTKRSVFNSKMSKLAQIHTYPPSLAKSKIMVKTFSLYHTGPVTCNSYFRHFETDSEKKNHYNSILFPERKKNGSKRPILFCLFYQDFPALVFSRQFQIISNVFWRLPKMSGVCKLRRNPKIFPFIFVVKNIFLTVHECVDKIFVSFSENILHALNSISFGNSQH